MFNIEKDDLQQVIVDQATENMNIKIENTALKRVISELRVEVEKNKDAKVED